MFYNYINFTEYSNANTPLLRYLSRPVDHRTMVVRATPNP